MASPSLLLGSLQGSPWPSSEQRGSAYAASAWRTCVRAKMHVQAAQTASAYVFLPERRFPHPCAKGPGTWPPLGLVGVPQAFFGG
eukprot:4876554-Alexandrium_andersonii.AAC.1